MTIWPVACPKPVRSAAPLPRFFSWKRIVRSGWVFSHSRSISVVPSFEQSSTRMICLLIGTARTCRTISPSEWTSL